MAASPSNRKGQRSSIQTPIYRDLELLLRWEISVVDRLPKSLGYQELGRQAILSTNESLTLVSLALKVEDDRAKSNALGALFVQLENIKSVFRTLRELSKDPSKPRVLTEKQYLHFIEIINRISYQQYAWAGKYAQRPESLDGDSSLNN